MRKKYCRILLASSNKYRVFIAGILSLFIVNSCRTAVCKSNGASLILYMNPTFAKSFDSAQLSVIDVTWYERGTNFQKITSHYVTGTSIRVGNGVDTLPGGITFQLTEKEDLILKLPVNDTEYRIRDFNWIQTKRKEISIAGGEMNPCTNRSQVYINDSLYTDPGSEYSQLSSYYYINGR